MLSVHPSIAPAVFALAPGFRAMSIVVEATSITRPEVASDALKSACQQV